MFWIKMKFTSSKKNTEILHEYMATNWKPNYWINSKNTEWNEKRLNKKFWNYCWIYMPFLNITDTVVWKIEIIESTYKSWWNYERNWK